MTTENNTPVKELLVQLNALREANGKKPLSDWKNSRTELLQRIADETPTPGADAKAQHKPEPDLAAVAAAITPDTPVTKVPAGKSVLAEQKRAAKAAAKNKQDKRKLDAKKAKGDRFGKGEFASYLESINMSGRVARAKLRRANIKKVDGRYPLNDEVKAALAADNRRKGGDDK